MNVKNSLKACARGRFVRVAETWRARKTQKGMISDGK